MQLRYTIVIEDGAFKGASLKDGDMKALPLDLTALAAHVAGINTAAISAKDELESKLAETAQHLDTIDAAIADERLDEAATIEAAKATLTEYKRPAVDKEQAAILAQIADLEAKLAKLSPAIEEPGETIEKP